jgi:hypothetical protein
LSTPVALEIVTRLSPSDWANGISDPRALGALLRVLTDDGWPLSLWVHQRLHAKVYIADSAACAIGSANLTNGGFARNFELVVSGGADLASQAETLVRSQLNDYGRQVTVDSLEDWVEASASAVEAAVDRDREADLLADSQRQLDRMLARVRGEPSPGRARPTGVPVQREIGEFFAWLRRRPGLRGARTILERHDNVLGQNLQGHVKQTFVGGQLFLNANPDLLRPCADALEEGESGDVPMLPGIVAERWSDFLDDNAAYVDDVGDFAVLRGILPPSLGGTRTGGGGGSSTLKRMLPLVAHFILSRAA